MRSGPFTLAIDSESESTIAMSWTKPSQQPET